ncbi:hypothetical protein DVH24_035996 [Malus domestica]|uniref:Uncharacterized protein n=1 Tax=Malus domestica TaxID=3750 RepID=A0A498JNK6_MALDO|nr:hypothetical protein DVH24_035996 [Malus domestica]
MKSNEKQNHHNPWREPSGSDTMLTALQKMKSWYRGRERIGDVEETSSIIKIQVWNACVLKYKVMPHNTQLIFTAKTMFRKLFAVFPPIPRHRFFLLDFNMLYPRLNRDDILTDNIKTYICVCVRVCDWPCNCGPTSGTKTNKSKNSVEVILSSIPRHRFFRPFLDIVMPHNTQLIFTAKTMFRKLSTVFPPIPRHRVFLLDFNMFYPRLNKDNILTGNIKTYMSVYKKELCVMLWGDVAEAFSSLSVHTLSLPIIIVFTSLKVKLYLDKVILNSTGSSLFFIDLDILEFSACKGAVQVLPPSSRQVNKVEARSTARRVTIDEVVFLDLDLYKNDTFLCKPSVKRFNTRYNWWYSACPNYVKQTHKDPATGQLIFNLILEDNTNEINALIIGKSG